MLPPVAPTKRTIADRAGDTLAWHLGRASRRSGWIVRRGTARLRLRPTFLVIGAQKAGTRSLHGYLSDHPAILCATPKEVHYFDYAYNRGDGWYRAHFPLATRHSATHRKVGVVPAVGEVTPAYLFDSLVPKRVHAFDPGMKLIAVLRDPVSRAYSHYQMQTRLAREAGSFEEALADEAKGLPVGRERITSGPDASESARRTSYIARGRYAEQLERWLELFPREQLLVLLSEELLIEPANAMFRIARFLDVPEYRSASYVRRNVNEYAPMDPATREQLALTYESDNRRLEVLLGRTLDWTRTQATSTRES